MPEPMPASRLADLLDRHMAVVAYLGETNQMPLHASWRLIMGDSYADDCIGPVCPHEDGHQILDDGTPDVHGQYNCCPHPVIECHHALIAAWLVELLNGFPKMAAEIRRLQAELDEAQEQLDEKVGQALLDKTMFKGLNVVDGQVHLDLDPAREVVLMWCAAMRGTLDGYGAENYVECEVNAETPAARVSMDIQDGKHSEDSYTVTIQRRYRPTPHEFRLRAEKERDDALAEVASLRAQLAAKEA